jgi:hypothetical protein
VSLFVKHFLLAGVPGIIWLVALITLLHHLLTGRNRVWVQGSITGFLKEEDIEGPSYRSRIMFDVDGRPIELLDELSFGYNAHYIGQRLWVGYRPDDPEQAQVWRIWPSLVCVGIFFAGAIVFWLGMSRMGE